MREELQSPKNCGALFVQDSQESQGTSKGGKGVGTRARNNPDEDDSEAPTPLNAGARQGRWDLRWVERHNADSGPDDSHGSACGFSSSSSSSSGASVGRSEVSAPRSFLASSNLLGGPRLKDTDTAALGGSQRPPSVAWSSSLHGRPRRKSTQGPPPTPVNLKK